MNVIAVGIGGFLGAIMRYSLGEWLQTSHGFPIGTLMINLFGCLFLSWFFTFTTKSWRLNSNLKLAIGTGFTGAFTTFSTFSIETLSLLENRLYLFAILYILLSVIGGIGLSFVGTKLASVFGLALKKMEGESK